MCASTAIPTPPEQNRPMKLSTLERVAASGLELGCEEDGAPVLREILAWAEALDSPTTREPARLRLVSKLLAASRAKLLLIERIRDHHLMAGNTAELRMAQRALDGETRRLAILLAEHRMACAADKRSVTVAVGQANTVNIAAVGGRG